MTGRRGGREAGERSGSRASSATVQPAALSGAQIFERPWRFLMGVVALEHLPPPERAEVAFAGRSNVGKSSLINALVRQKGLARTSNTPGRTQELNFFVADGVALAVVDLPGYGFAEAPKDKVRAWTGLIKSYLRGRQALTRVYLLIDARHGIKTVDEEIMALLDEAAVSYQLVLTKMDKVKPAAREACVAAAKAALSSHAAAFPEVLATSSELGEGITELRDAIAQLYAEVMPAGSP
jgi:GTP-binding protein